MEKVDWNKHSKYLLPVDILKNKAHVEWACSCSICQCERILSYEQALNIAKGKYDRDCLSCKIEKGIYSPNIKGLSLGRKNNQKGKQIKKPSNSRIFPYLQIFKPEIWNNPEVRKKQSVSKLKLFGVPEHLWGNRKRPKRINNGKYQSLRKEVFKRDGHACCYCGSEERLELHHVKDWANNPGLRYDTNNCLTLCHICHKKTDNYGFKNSRKTHVI